LNPSIPHSERDTAVGLMVEAVPVPPPMPPEAAEGEPGEALERASLADRDAEREHAATHVGTVWDGRYEIDRLIGEGGMGEVFLARDLADDGLPVAVKVLQPRFREVATPYFLREWVMQRALRHPAIARALELGFDHQRGDEVPYFAMQYVPGVPLATLFGEVVPIESIWRWTLETLQALDLIHRMGYLHRDVKPGNILVDREARRGPAARLIDFGIAIQLSAEPEEFFIGTPEYSSPERMACEALDPSADLYSVGLILYELIQGDVPWEGWEPEDLWLKRTTTPPPPITNPACPEAVRQLIYQMLATEPADRPRSAAEVIVRLCSATGLEPVIESDQAFAMRLATVPVPSARYEEALAAEARTLVLRVPEGHDGRAVLHELADRAAVNGVRVVRVRLEGRPERPLGELEPALDVFRRLRMSRDPDLAPEILAGIAGAATMLTRLHRPTLLVLEGIQNADAAVFALLSTVFTGASHAYLNVVATVDHGREALHPGAFEDFLARPFVRTLEFGDLSPEETEEYLTRALGEGALDPRLARRLYEQTHGRPINLLTALVEAYRRGDLVRTPDRYEWRGRLDLPETTRTRARRVATEVAELLSVLRGPLPASAVQRYLDDPDHYEELVDKGLLSTTAAGWVVSVRQETLFPLYERLSAVRRRILHQRLADALAATEPFPGRASLIADQLARTARPAQAVPMLLAAAQEATEHRHEARALAHIDRASELVAADAFDDEDAWQWRVLVARANLDFARRTGDWRRLAEAGEVLSQLGVEAAHMPTIERGLVAKIDCAWFHGDFAGMVAEADQLVLFQQTCAAPRALALQAWARSVEAWSRADVEVAFRLSEDGLRSLAPEDHATRVKLLTLRAELAVACAVVPMVERAISALLGEGRRNASLTTISRAGVLRAAWLRRTGDVSAALAKIEAVSGELGARHRPGLNGLIELEFGRCHLALGRLTTAEEHASRAAEWARRDRDPATAFAAEAQCAAVLLQRGAIDEALSRLGVLLAAVPPQVMPHGVFEVRGLWLRARFEVGEEAAPIIADADALAATASVASDAAGAMRAVMVATRTALRHRYPILALRYAEWLTEIARQRPVGGVPDHAVNWLLACAHYQMKWFKSAHTLSLRALEGLREATHGAVEAEHRGDWLRAADNALVGSGRWDGQIVFPLPKNGDGEAGGRTNGQGAAVVPVSWERAEGRRVNGERFAAGPPPSTRDGRVGPPPPPTRSQPAAAPGTGVS